MQIEYTHDLLQTCMTICYNGRSLTIDNLVVDTGAAHSLLSSDIVSEIGDFIMEGIPIDFGVFHDDINYINDLIGLDILKNGNMIIDLHRMEMYPANLNHD